MQIIIGDYDRKLLVEYDSLNQPICIKFSIQDLKKIIENIKKGDLVYTTIPKGHERPGMFDKLRTLVKYERGVKALLRTSKRMKKGESKGIKE